MKIAVVGGSGFIGSHLVDKLIMENHEVTVFDIMRPHRPDVGHIYIDITSLSRTTIALSGRYDALYLLAAVANVDVVSKNPVESAEVNILGVVNVLEAARRNAIPRVLFSSTVWVYNLAQENTVDEDTPFIINATDHVYTASKIAAEALCVSYQRLYGIKTTILRFGIPYGPRAREATVLFNFVKNALLGKPITILGDGSQKRSFVYIEDLAYGCMAALQVQAENKIYNLEGAQPVTIKGLAEIVQRHIGSCEIVHMPARSGDYVGKIVSNSKARMELGWEPKVSLEEGVGRYIEWFKNNSYVRNE